MKVAKDCYFHFSIGQGEPSRADLFLYIEPIAQRLAVGLPLKIGCRGTSDPKQIYLRFRNEPVAINEWH